MDRMMESPWQCHREMEAAREELARAKREREQARLDRAFAAFRVEPLSRAISTGDVGEVERLLTSGVPCGTSHIDDITHLHYALHQTHGECDPERLETVNRIARLLVMAGVDLAAREKPGLFTPLELAVVNWPGITLDTIRLLLERGADMHAVNAYGETPLYRVIECRDAHQVVELLLEFQDDGQLDQSRLDGDNRPLHMATFCGNAHVTRMLLGRGVTVDCINGRGYTPLQIAAANGNAGTVSALLEHGASITATGLHGDQPPLRLAIFFNANPETVKLLIEAGANPGSWENEGVAKRWPTPLEMAKRLKREGIVRLLLEAGA
ncbi:MAG: ankyrin repeat domain-containing protein [Rhodobacteraceae bacterium]|nr:ankyrin repeat domain-containing protein [Paracoccaceae bacterium]